MAHCDHDSQGGSLSIEHYAERFVYSALIAAGAAVGGIAAIVDYRQRRHGSR